MLEYTEQSYEDIRLLVGEDLFKESDFTVIKRSEFNGVGLDIKFGILAESHYVSITSNNSTFDELCICTDVLIKKALSSKLIDLKESGLKTRTENFDYRTQPAYHMGKEGKTRVDSLKSKFSETNVFYLEHKFPTLRPDEKAAETILCLTLIDNNRILLIESVHTYPNEDTYVFLTTRIKIII